MLHTDPQIVIKQIESVNVMWEATCRLSSNLPSILMIISNEEYQKGSADNHLQAAVLEKTDIVILLEEAPESVRPYISDDLWNVFYIARAFVCRLHLLVNEAINTSPGERTFWFEDTVIKQYLDQFWSENEYSIWLNYPGYGMLITWHHIEQKILEESRKVLDIPSEGELLPDEVRITGFRPSASR